MLLRLRSDDQLVALFRQGNEEAFRVIHDRYRQRLLAYTRQMLSGSAEAEDALQDVFLRAYNSLRADERPVTLRAWLYRVAHNRCIDHLRKPVAQSVELDEIGGVMADASRDSFTEAARRDELRQLVCDIERLPEQQRSALLMREMEGLSYQELADVLSVSVPSVKSLLVRARMGLVEAREARDTDCVDIRSDLAHAHTRGVRASGRVRRHLRDCDACTDYRASLKGLDRQLAALNGGGSPWSLLAKLFGIGGSGAGAAAGGGAVAGGGAGASGTTLAGGVAAATATKVAAVVCCAAIVGGGAVEVGQRDKSASPSKPSSAPAAASSATAAAHAQAPRSFSPLATAVSQIRAAKSAAGHQAARPAAKSAPHHTSVVLATVGDDPTGARSTGSYSSGTGPAATSGAALAPDDGTAPAATQTPASQDSVSSTLSSLTGDDGSSTPAAAPQTQPGSAQDAVPAAVDAPTSPPRDTGGAQAP